MESLFDPIENFEAFLDEQAQLAWEEVEDVGPWDLKLAGAREVVALPLGAFSMTESAIIIMTQEVHSDRLLFPEDGDYQYETSREDQVMRLANEIVELNIDKRLQELARAYRTGRSGQSV